MAKDDKKRPATDKPLIKITDKLWKVLEEMQDNPLTWSIADLDRNPLSQNPMRVEEIDLGDKEYRINCKIAGKYVPIKLSAFVRNMFGEDQFYKEEIDDFVERYNDGIKGKSTKRVQQNYIEQGDFKYDPQNVRQTFLSLVQETYPHGHEEEVVPFITPDLERDDFGNLYKIIGESDTVFTCHLDTASRNKTSIKLRSYEKDGDEIIATDGTTILGADDKAGVTVLMHMIANNIPGVYWFFLGEERGGLGSKHVANNIEKYPFMEGKAKCVSFDRRNYHSVITKQMGVQCCSNEFGQELASALSQGGISLSLDPTGVFTDSASFIDLIPECTNVSVGYFDEHRNTEIQNMTYLEKLCKATVNCDWSSLKAHRKLMKDDESYKKNKTLADHLDKTRFYNFDRVFTENEMFVFELDVQDASYEHLRTDLTKLENILKSHKITSDLIFNQNKIRVEIP